MKPLLFPVALILTLAACTQAPPPAPDTREADAKAIRDAEATVLKAWNAKDVDKVAAFYAENASFLAPNMPTMNGVAAFKPTIKEMTSDPNFAMAFAATKVEVSKSSDYGYSQGTYTLTTTDAKSKKAMTEKGKYLTVYQKQADGSWKAVADTFNADGPATPAK